MDGTGHLRGSDTRSRILAAARELFARHGYRGATVRAIGQRCGVSDAALYHHFPGKRALYDAVLSGQPVLSAAKTGGDDVGREAILAMLVGLETEWAQQPELVAILFAQSIAGDAEATAANVRMRGELQAMLQPGLEALGGGPHASEALSLVLCGQIVDNVLRSGARYADAVLSPEGVDNLRDAIELILPAADAARLWAAG